jgi:type VI secretion system protein ImpE
VFAGKRTPQVMGTPPGWIGSLIEALRFDGSGNAASAATLREQAMSEAEPRACVVDGVSCEWLADGDSRLGPVCEIVANGQYYWLPFESCQGIYLDVPTDLRDLVWAPGEVVLPNEGRVAVLIPTRYAGTEAVSSNAADELKRSQRTEWSEPHPGMWFGTGQRLWTTDLGDHAILDTRSIVMNAAETLPGAVTTN